MFDAEIQTTRQIEQATAAQALPRLRALRTELEARGGALVVARRNHAARLVVCGGVAALAGLYALWTSVAGAASVLAWALFALAAAAGLLLHLRWSMEVASRKEAHEALQKKMHVVSQHIERAERAARG
jgi:hypothetical protein